MGVFHSIHVHRFIGRYDLRDGFLRRRQVLHVRRAVDIGQVRMAYGSDFRNEVRRIAGGICRISQHALSRARVVRARDEPQNTGIGRNGIDCALRNSSSNNRADIGFHVERSAGRITPRRLKRISPQSLPRPIPVAGVILHKVRSHRNTKNPARHRYDKTCAARDRGVGQGGEIRGIVGCYRTGLRRRDRMGVSRVRGVCRQVCLHGSRGAGRIKVA